MKNLILAFTVFTFGANMAMGDLGKAGAKGNSASSPAGGPSSSPFAGVPNLCQAKVEETKRTFKSMFGFEPKLRIVSSGAAPSKPSLAEVLASFKNMIIGPAGSIAPYELNSLSQSLLSPAGWQALQKFVMNKLASEGEGYVEMARKYFSSVVNMPLGVDAQKGLTPQQLQQAFESIAKIKDLPKVTEEKWRQFSKCVSPADALVVAAFAALVASPAAGLMVKNATKGKRPFNGVSNAAAVATALGLLLFAASLED